MLYNFPCLGNTERQFHVMHLLITETQRVEKCLMNRNYEGGNDSKIYKLMLILICIYSPIYCIYRNLEMFSCIPTWKTRSEENTGNKN